MRHNWFGYAVLAPSIGFLAALAFMVPTAIAQEDQDEGSVRLVGDTHTPPVGDLAADDEPDGRGSGAADGDAVGDEDVRFRARTLILIAVGVGAAVGATAGLVALRNRSG